MARHHRRAKVRWHPVLGEIRLDCAVLLVSERDQHVVLCTAQPGTTGYEALQLLKVVGTQKLATAEAGRGTPPVE